KMGDLVDAAVAVVVALLTTRLAGRIQVRPAVHDSVQIQVDRAADLLAAIAHDDDIRTPVAIGVDALRRVLVHRARLVFDRRLTTWNVVCCSTSLRAAAAGQRKDQNREADAPGSKRPDPRVMLTSPCNHAGAASYRRSADTAWVSSSDRFQ